MNLTAIVAAIQELRGTFAAGVAGADSLLAEIAAANPPADPPPVDPPPTAPPPTTHSVILSFLPVGSAALADATLFKTNEFGHSVYRKPLNDVLVAWFETWTAPDGSHHVLAWLENGFLRTAGLAYAGDLALIIDGVTRSTTHITCLGYTAPAVCLPVCIESGFTTIAQMKLSAPDYSRLPKYGAPVAPALLDVYAKLTYAPYSAGLYPPVMGATGYDPSIGWMQGVDSAYMATRDDRAFNGMICNALAAGKYPLFRPDSKTNDVFVFADNPNLSGQASTTNDVTPTAVGPDAPLWDLPHAPSVGFEPFLATGIEYFRRLIQMSAATSWLYQVDWTRLFGQGDFLTDAGANITRGAAWDIRTMCQAAIVSPPGSQFETTLLDNFAYYHSKYIVQQSNPLGVTQPYFDYTGPDGLYVHPMWMDDFLTGTFAACQLAYPTNVFLQELNAWKMLSVIGRAGAPDDLTAWDARFMDYTMPVAPSDTPDWVKGTGPWFKNWGESFTAAGHVRTPADGILTGSSGATPSGDGSYYANMLWCLFAAVTLKQPGAEKALAQWTGAVNWPGLAAAIADTPEWGAFYDPALIVTTAAPPAPSPSSPATLPCAEDATFALDAPALVRFGPGPADPRFVEKLCPAGATPCTNEAFGSDPAQGVVKQCYLPGAAPSPPAATPPPSPAPAPVPAPAGSGAVDPASWLPAPLAPGATRGLRFNVPMRNSLRDVLNAKYPGADVAGMLMRWTDAAYNSDLDAWGVIGDGHNPTPGLDNIQGIGLLALRYLMWSLRCAPVDINLEYTVKLDQYGEYPDKSPEASHTYNGIVSVPASAGFKGAGAAGAFVQVGMVADAPAGNSVHVFDPLQSVGGVSRLVDQLFFAPNQGQGAGSYCAAVYDAKRNVIWTTHQSSGYTLAIAPDGSIVKSLPGRNYNGSSLALSMTGDGVLVAIGQQPASDQQHADIINPDTDADWRSANIGGPVMPTQRFNPYGGGFQVYTWDSFGLEWLPEHNCFSLSDTFGPTDGDFLLVPSANLTDDWRLVWVPMDGPARLTLPSGQEAGSYTKKRWSPLLRATVEMLTVDGPPQGCYYPDIKALLGS